MKMKP